MNKKDAWIRMTVKMCSVTITQFGVIIVAYSYNDHDTVLLFMLVYAQ